MVSATLVDGESPLPVALGDGALIIPNIDQTQPEADFLGEWVLMHELSHLLHPNLRPPDPVTKNQQDTSAAERLS